LTSDLIENLNKQVVQCRLCPRLVAWREEVAATRRKSFQDEEYWGRPVPYFGDFAANRLIVGLAPAAHGANRTGRMFTGDRSGDFLFAALYRVGVANQPTSVNAKDGLRLDGALIAATLHCAPPANKPLPSEVQNCSRYLLPLISSGQFRSVLCLGGIAWNHAHKLLQAKPPKFAHGAVSTVGQLKIVASYHVSQQNTFTGKLTEAMFDEVLKLWLT
jgi:uracil-DNA glycosylase family 4